MALEFDAGHFASAAKLLAANPPLTISFSNLKIKVSEFLQPWHLLLYAIFSFRNLVRTHLCTILRLNASACILHIPSWEAHVED